MTPLRTLLRELASNASGIRAGKALTRRASALVPAKRSLVPTKLSSDAPRAGTTPLGALGRGLVAGAAGAAAQSLFFAVTTPIMPPPATDAFDPPDPEQKDENALETISRRLVEGLMRRGPITREQKKIIANLVHVGFGARWGALYGLTRESYPEALSSPAGIAAFSTAVWLLGDNLLLQLFKLSGPPTAYPLRTHLYGLAAHLVYGAGLAGTDELLARSRKARYAALGLGTIGLAWTALRLVGSSESPPSKARVANVKKPRPATADASTT